MTDTIKVDKVKLTMEAMSAHKNLAPLTRLFNAACAVIDSAKEADVPQFDTLVELEAAVPQFDTLVELEAAVSDVCDAALGIGRHAISTTNKVEDASDGAGTEGVATDTNMVSGGSDEGSEDNEAGAAPATGGTEATIPSNN